MKRNAASRTRAAAALMPIKLSPPSMIRPAKVPAVDPDQSAARDLCTISERWGDIEKVRRKPDRPPWRFCFADNVAGTSSMTEIGFVKIRPPLTGGEAEPRRAPRLADQEPITSALQSKARDHVAGQELTFEGDAAAPVLFVLDGWLGVSKSLGDGQRQIIDFVLPGDFVASASADGTTSTLQIDALTDARVAVFSEIQWTRLQWDRPDLHWQAIHLHAASQARLSERILRLGKGNAPMRIAYALLELCLRLKAVCNGKGCNFHLPLTQMQIGDFTGLSSVHVCRTMRKLVQSGIIAIDGHSTIRINDVAALSKIAGVDIRQLSREIMPRGV